MPEVIVFEKFADFLTKKQRFKKNYVHNVIKQGVYRPEEDYYLNLRQRLKSLMKKNSSLNELDIILKKIAPKKFDNYEVLIDQIQNYMQNKKYTWVTPPRYTKNYSGLMLTVNPEIGLQIDEKTYFIKMYFKKKELDSEKVGIMQKIMQDALKNDFPDTNVAVWDIRQGILHDVPINKEVSIPYDLENEAIIWQKYAEEE